MADYYELTDEKKGWVDGIVLYRIRALRPIPEQGVRAGNYGGWVQHKGNIRERGWVSDNAMVYGDACVRGSARVSDNAKVYGQATISGSALVTGYSEVFSRAVVTDMAHVREDARVYGEATVSGNASVSMYAKVSGSAQILGSAKIIERADISGKATVKDTACVADHAQVFGNAIVRSTAYITGHVQVNGDAKISDCMLYANAAVGGDAIITQGAFIYGNAKITGGCVRLARIGHEAVIKSETDYLLLSTPTPKDDYLVCYRSDGETIVETRDWRTPLEALETTVSSEYETNYYYSQKMRLFILKEYQIIAELCQNREKLWISKEAKGK